MFDDHGPSERAYRDGFEDGRANTLWMVAIGAAMRAWQIDDVYRWSGSSWSVGLCDAYKNVVEDALKTLAEIGDEDIWRVINGG